MKLILINRIVASIFGRANKSSRGWELLETFCFITCLNQARHLGVAPVMAIGISLWFLAIVTLSAMEIVANPEVSSTSKAPIGISLRLIPRQANLWGHRSSQRFAVLCRYSDGVERDVTLSSAFSISDPSIANIQEARVTSVGDGQAVLRVEFQNLRVEARVHIRNSLQLIASNFERNIVRILTKNGCNDSECHGAIKGKGGFKLSLNGRFPREDYRWIVEGERYRGLTPSSESKNPRVKLNDPKKSLLLLKPTLSLDHGGGKRFNVGSPNYQAILDWVQSGAPYEQDNDGSSGMGIRDLEVMPKETVLDANGRQQLVVVAQLLNGREEDITDQVRYTSGNTDVVKVTSEGLVTGVSKGETDVIIRAPGYSVSARFGVIDSPITPFPDLPHRNFIDEYVNAKLRRFHILPSGLSNDEEFLRRVCLDVTGTLPSPQRVREFLASQKPDKRDELIEVLLNSPEYVDYWTFRFADFLRVMWSNSYTYKSWIHNGLTSNKPFDQMARERISIEGVAGGARHYFKRTGEMLLPEELMIEDARAFLGLRLDCAQCHDHPYEAWTQNQFWGMAAFYGAVSRVRDFGVVFDDPMGHGERRNPKIMNPRTNEEAQARFLDGIVPNPGRRSGLRVQLGKWITSTSNSYFSKVAVNRIWAHFFGKGITNPVDDFRATNPATHPGLLEALAQSFQENSYDLKYLMRLILQSRTYQVSSDWNETNRSDELNYTRSLPRRLDAEVLLDAISRVTGVEEKFAIHDYIVSNSLELPGTQAIDLIPELTPSHFLEVYGRPPLRETIPIRDRQANLRQALHMLVGSTFTEKISSEGGRLSQLIKDGASDKMIIEEFYLAALSRFPSRLERAEISRLINKLKSRRKAIEGLVWGLIASREFTYNH